MAITMQWDDPEESILTVKITGRFTWDEALTVTKQASAMVGSKTQRYDVIYDLQQGKAESYGSALQHGRQIVREFPPNIGMFVLVTASLGRALLNPLKRLDPEIAPIVHTARTHAEARALIERNRQTAAP